MPPRMADSADQQEPVAPPVLEPDNVGEAEDTGAGNPETPAGDDSVGFPPVVYVPCDSTTPRDGQLSLDLRRLEDGRAALPVFSSTESLVRCCGPHQPWVAVPGERLDGLDELIEFDVILLDVEISADLRRREGSVR